MLKVARTDYCCPVAAPTKITALAHVKAHMGEEAAAVSTGGGSEELAEVLVDKAGAQQRLEQALAAAPAPHPQHRHADENDENQEEHEGRYDAFNDIAG